MGTLVLKQLKKMERMIQVCGYAEASQIGWPCEEDPHFLELTRYFRLNRLRAGMVKGLEELGRFP